MHHELLSVWRFVLANINYHAVFNLASRILVELPADVRLDDSLRRASEKILDVARMQVALEHDLAGRIYHLLLGDIAKHLGTYYTSVSAAVLLVRLGLDPARWQHVDWSDVKQVAALRIGDFACGTGTLLAASVQAVVDNFLKKTVQRSGVKRLPTHREFLLRALLEDGVWGLDVLPSAVHLTATTLALPVPDVMPKGMRLYSLDLGVRNGKARLGSLDLLQDAPLTASLAMFPFSGTTKGKKITSASETRVSVPLPSEFDLITMNPPFTRTCGDNLLFGSVRTGKRGRLQGELQKTIRKKKVRASITAGLGSVFLATADRYLKSAGRLAFVLPKSVLSGVDWKPTRELLSQGYAVETIIASHDPKRWNFSENTDLSEVLLIAVKTTDAGHRKTLCVNLWSNEDVPMTAFEIVEQLRRGRIPPLAEGALSVRVGEHKVGEAFTLDWTELRALPHWLFPCAFAQNDLNRLLLELHRNSRLRMAGNEFLVPLSPLYLLGELGPDQRRLWATFEE
jgi:hypothetical protein